MTRKNFDELDVAEDLESKFVELKRLSENSKKKSWRPTAIPPQDSYGVRRPLLMAHIQKLKQYKAQLEFHLN